MYMSVEFGQAFASENENKKTNNKCILRKVAAQANETN